MSDQVSWFLEVAITPGQFESFRRLVDEMVESARAENGALDFRWYVDDEGSVGHIYERYADSDAVLAHLGIFGDKFAGRLLTAVSPTRFTVLGRPPDEVMQALSGFGPTYLRLLNGFAR